MQAILCKCSVGTQNCKKCTHAVHMHSVPSMREVRRESSVAFLRPGGRETPMESSVCRNT